MLKEPIADAHQPAGGTSSHDRLARAIDHAAHLLPAQGPITVFIHHNTLHAFEDRPFEQAVVRGAETFGAPGFYGVAMHYRGAAEAHYVPLRPIVVRPGHWVEEQVPDDHRPAFRQRTKARRAVGAVTPRFHLGTRSFAAGAVLSAGVGALAAVPLVARVLFPLLAARLRRRFGEMVEAPGRTRLELERAADPPAPDGGHLGYTVAEMTAVAEGLLRSAGLTRTFSRLAVIVGHGSHSMNNPHESAHDCGACGGAVGGPNGRA
ncbi:MAG: DUF2309 domain-containing protein, partial [Gemmataceae bacterium]|nr:DUF2309 domain-containing protein [Gemmataceae bacterium]